MSRNEAAEAMPSAESELLRKLDESLRDRATKIVDAAIKEIEGKAIRMVAEDLAAVSGNVIKSDVLRHFEQAFSRIRDSAIRLTYADLVKRVTTQLTDGKPVDLA